MDYRKYVLKETGIVALGQAVGVGAMLLIFALLDHFGKSVLLGGIVGGLVATANFFFMAMFAMLAADKAEAQDVAGGQKIVKLSQLGRLLVMFVVFFAFAKSGLGNVFAMIVPLLFVRPTLYIGEFFRKSGEKQA